MFLLLGWSWAKPVRIRPENLKSCRWGETAVPLSNFLLALLFFVFRRLLPQGIWAQLLLCGVSVSLTLCSLSLLPVSRMGGFFVLLGPKAGKVRNYMEKYGLVLYCCWRRASWIAIRSSRAVGDVVCVPDWLTEGG